MANKIVNLDSYVNYVQGYYGGTTVSSKEKQILTWIETTLRNYLQKNEENVCEIEHILDFFFSPSSPARVKFMAYKTAKQKSEAWSKTLQKKGSKIVELASDVRVVKTYEDGKYAIVQLLGENAFKREGFLMRHCVGSYYAKEDVIIYSLRDANNQPHATIEVTRNGEQISQVKGKSNGSIHPKYVDYVLDFLNNCLKMPVRETELRYLGYDALPNIPEFLQFLNENGFKDKLKSFENVNGDFLYRY